MSATRTFETDTDNGRIARDSLQGQFTEHVYDSCAHFRTDVQTALLELPRSIVEEANKAGGVYPVGTTLRVKAPGRMAYLVALPSVNEHGTAIATFEDLKQALPALWVCMLQRGELGVAAIPIIGSGRARVPETRESIVREIVQSFVAACASSRFCEKLTIVISPYDFHRHELDFAELERFVRHLCRYTDIREMSSTPRGTGID